ncbi:HET-domain-containing protein [Mollisia scopiformis]|uniref:HET-domain-containing protein n=1 Tax=Mollisia scopiformis TaxID=149040 RepID=A0A194XC46_MOLSC|nr:HET-domain-containing protein [Mollisia scopiformis]KUJ17731.1 HET-domain-containing protein [Mollisia scopiformis]
MADQSQQQLPSTDNPSTVKIQDTTSESFSYSPLENTDSERSIRLIMIKPVKRLTSDIECELVHVKFGDKPNYEALSYAWGSDLTTRAIKINGKTLLVRESLWKVLAKLRHRDEPRCLWVDAICINQSDIAEKNSQVRLMPHIYRKATTVIVWLGIVPVDMLSALIASGYWNRVCIVQEIGKAKTIRVHWNSKSLT